MSRFAYVATTVPRRADVARGPVDAEWLLSHGEPVVFVDHDSPGSNDLRAAGIEVYVSPKRPNVIPGSVTLSADHIQARLVAQEHRAAPLDYVLYSAAMTTDFAWFERSLAGVPRGVTLGDGIFGDLRLLTSDAALFQHFGRRAWATSGFVASADFVLSDAPAAAYGLDEAHLPTRVSTGHGGDLPPPGPPAAAPHLLAVVATGATSLELAALLDATAERVPIESHTVIVVIHRDLSVGPELAADLILDGCPPELRQQTILVPPGDDGAAAAFLDSADLIAVANLTDLAIHAVGAAARRAGYVVLDDAEPVPADELNGLRAKVQPSGHTVLVPVDGSPAEAVAAIDRLVEGSDFLVLHSPEHAADARRFIGMPGLSSVDLACLGYPDPVFGLPEARHPNPFVLGVRNETWRSVRRRARHASSLFELTTWCLDLSLAANVRLLVVPGSGDGCQPLASDHIAGLPTWVTSTGILPPPVPAGVSSTDTPPPPLGSGEPDVQTWVAGRGWADRARLALPWKGGLLERAMRGRW